MPTANSAVRRKKTSDQCRFKEKQKREETLGEKGESLVGVTSLALIEQMKEFFGWIQTSAEEKREMGGQRGASDGIDAPERLTLVLLPELRELDERRP